MLRTLKTVVAAAALLFAAALGGARAADAPTADDTAKFLAGMTPSANSPLMALTRDPAWQRHAKFFDSAFGQLDQRQMSRVRAWSEANIAAPKPTMFYMFSGPDFLYANAFYPRATTYVLSALEPPGSIPDLMKVPPGSIAATLSDVEHSLGSILSFSFFITRKMKVDLHEGELNGAMPLLYVFLARSGKTIKNVSSLALDAKGTAYFANENPGGNAVRGVRIVFAGRDGVDRTLYYFSTDLSDSSVRVSGFLKFCATLAPGNSLIKSASYLMHSPSFSAVRDFILANSAAIIQDDSGIPLGYFGARKWRLFPFGRYAGPIAEFPNKYQESYAELFQRAQPLDFGIGYRWHSHESNLLLAVRSPDDGAATADATSSTEVTAPPAPRPKRPRRPHPQQPLPWPEPPHGFLWFQ
ncbi:hypothetical protein [Bradyrhizobium sp.]|uniref:hypothetical protein n=1 Tax=Bradyrhizobium sp. TaxID=376 RepID=UPI00261AE749|nr:hypothetical protein [Bradyrhizobium sp.]